ncbi:MAG: hypothetical protein M2R45_02168 [Verrucomicrobia subdivision 3 bacterium]|nr:hypothetical protein [Limisphaerales bacterium]MCS1413744.1 hypothetical protein [Limisphaerales bacterium]
MLSATPANLVKGRALCENVVQIGLLRTRATGTLSAVMLSETVGAPLFGPSIFFLFGAVISPSATDENGNLCRKARSRKCIG